VSNNPCSFSLLLVHNGALTSSPEWLFRPLPVSAINGARAPPLNPLSHVHVPLLRNAPARGRNDVQGQCPRVAAAQSFLSSVFAATPRMHRIWTVGSRTGGSDLKRVYPFRAVHRGPVHQVHGAVHGSLSRWIRDPWLG
jgi:hypothetical protein